MGLRDRVVVLGMSGGIACYKACEVVRLLRDQGAEVRVVMTAGARHFVTPLTLQTLSGHAVGTDVFSCAEEAEIGHIRLADAADVVAVAPATANLLAKMAHGIADDLLTTVLLATRAPVLVAPAMNVNMWEHPATRDNVAILERRGVTIVGPTAGALACGYEGAGRLLEPARIVEEVGCLLASRDLEGEHVVVSAGPTREALDPIRFLSNRSTGRMGYALARVARRRGARVTLVRGPTAIEPPAGVTVIDAVSAADMATAIRRAARGATVVAMAAAVADYRPQRAATRKLKKGPGGRTIRLERTEDILAGLGARRGRGRRLLIGFAAETHDVEGEARRKLAAKHLDLIVANDVGGAGAGFESDTNIVQLIDRHGLHEALPLLDKDEVAERIFDWVVARRQAARPGRPAS